MTGYSERHTRLAQLVRILKHDGPAGILQRTARRAYLALGADRLDFEVLLEDIFSDEGLDLPSGNRTKARGVPLHIGFVLVAPGLYSGGHTTLFRLVAALESRGHRCTLFLHDRHHGMPAQRKEVIRKSWPHVRAGVLDVKDGLRGLDAVVATSWPTAHIVATHTPFPVQRFYLIQDFEPWFYPRGTQYALAEATYGFGFRHLTIGSMLARYLGSNYGVEATALDFGCDRDTYTLTNTGPRDGICFYARRDAPRRGFELGMLALERFHELSPSTPIHLFGDPGVTATFPAVNHGRLAPASLSHLYNSVHAGLVISFTNVSLAPEEMLACGLIPVINESPVLEPSDLSSPFIVESSPTPRAIAGTLASVLQTQPNRLEVSESARSDGWAPAQAAFVDAVESAVYPSESGSSRSRV